MDRTVKVTSHGLIYVIVSGVHIVSTFSNTKAKIQCLALRNIRKCELNLENVLYEQTFNTQYQYPPCDVKDVYCLTAVMKCIAAAKTSA